ncbi:hypothetical protein OEZ60_13660 [Defluviimonas sp. WL0024]|uniref:Uncharacterized protein n=1 Tax=Albidovulum salinarum TaxID=2984153 RepID=A0ABT2X5Q3_9RHOB|nr:hypothetical protein [Defluviimonas sp. WL0024]MCU9849049.1 hypothetical protein [Defluviimonas sp. WL0024]
MIEGSDAGALGTREMPIWGSRYRLRVNAAQDPNFSPWETEAYVRTRILSLIEYLSTLQVEQGRRKTARAALELAAAAPDLCGSTQRPGP